MGIDVFKPLAPDILGYEGRGQLLAGEDVLVHAHHQCFLVVRPVEDTDVAAARQHPGGSPQEVVIQLFTRRRLERVNLTAERVDARHHVLDGAVLAGRVHGLEDQQDRPAVLGIEPLLQVGQPLDAVRQQLVGGVLQGDTPGIGGLDVGQPKAGAVADAIARRDVGERRCLHAENVNAGQAWAGVGASTASTSSRPWPLFRTPWGTPSGATSRSPAVIRSSWPSSRNSPLPSST